MRIIFLLTFAIFIPSSFLANNNSPCKVADLKCEHLNNPLGIDTPKPRLSWKLIDNRTGAKQTAYQLIIGTDSVSVLSNEGNVWQTEKRDSDHLQIVYDGKELSPFTRYYWKVNIWDKEDVCNSSTVHSFETGMISMANWQGSWISDNKSVDYKPAPYFRKKININKKIQSARAYIAVAGLYEMYINGKRIGNHRLDPAYTRFDRRNLYTTYDVTPQLKNGDNVIGIVLGNGWYNHQSMAVWDFHNAPWRNRPTFCLDLHIVYDDGDTETIVSDLSWKTSSGTITFNSIYTAEHHDARLEQKGWNTASFDDSTWERVKYRSAPSPNITAQQLEPIRNVEIITAKSIKQINDSTYLFDFARNMSGVTKLNVSGEKNTIIKLKHGERLDENGRLDLSNINVYHHPVDDSDPFQTDIVVLSGNGTDEFTPKFNYKGFRYVEVSSSKPVDLSINSLTAYFMHSDVKPAGEINASNPIIRKLWEAANNSYLSNLAGYPTDCPQREKNGWTGDGHLAIETALYNFDAISIYEKWMADHRDEQQPNGVLPDIIPTGGWGYGTANGVDWTSTIAIIPWNLYLFYGDIKCLADCYENIKRYVDYIDRQSPNGLTNWGRGDWVPVKSSSNLELTSSIYYYVDASILAKTAKLLGKKEDHTHYSALADKIRSAINAKFLDRATGIYANGTQTELSVPLQWGITPEDMISKVAGNLAEKVKESDFHLDVGVLGAKAILNALSENGYADVAYRVAVQDTYPSWGWWIVNGATTLLENWDLKAGKDISDNHMMFGEIGGWFYKGLGGIKPDEEQPGYKHIILRPNFIKELQYFEAKHNSPYGYILSGWEWKKQLKYNVEIPPNSNATLYLPENVDTNQRIIKLESGKYSFTFKMKKETK